MPSNKKLNGTVIVTYRCNARCNMCNRYKEPSRPEDELTLDTIRKLPPMYFTNITGGEPFIREDLPDIVRELYKKSDRIVISTNGFFTDRILALCEEFPEVGIRISIEGMPWTNDEIRGLPDGFERGYSTLEQLVLAGHPDVGFGMTIQDRNAADLVPLYEVSDILGMEFATASLHNSFYFVESGNVIHDRQMVAQHIEDLVNRLLESNEPKKWFRAYFNHGLINYIYGQPRLLPCDMAFDTFFIDPFGDVMPCNGTREKLVMGNLNRQPWDELWNSTEAKAVRACVRKCDRNCWMIGSVSPAMHKYIQKPAAWVAAHKMRPGKKYDMHELQIVGDYEDGLVTRDELDALSTCEVCAHERSGEAAPGSDVGKARAAEDSGEPNLRVLIITTVKVGFDGLTSHILSYAKNMDKSDMRIDLVSARGIDPDISPQLREAGFDNIYRLEYRDTNQPKYFHDLVRVMKEGRYDIVHAHGNSATLAVDLMAGMVAGVPVRIAHSHTTSSGHPNIDKMLRPAFRHCYTDGFACGQDAGRWLFGDGEFTVIPNGKEIDRFLFDPAVRERMRQDLLLRDDDAVAIGHVAAFVSKKNHRFFIETFSELVEQDPRYELFLFGIEGDSLEDTLALIDELGLGEKVHYMGTRDNIEDYLQAMDLMVLPSLYEGFPVTVLEWQINGLPCLVSDTVTKDCNVTGAVEFLPIDKGASPWINSIKQAEIDANRRSDSGIKKRFAEAGFDIEENAAELKRKYTEIMTTSLAAVRDARH